MTWYRSGHENVKMKRGYVEHHRLGIELLSAQIQRGQGTIPFHRRVIEWERLEVLRFKLFFRRRRENSTLDRGLIRESVNIYKRSFLLLKDYLVSTHPRRRECNFGQ